MKYSEFKKQADWAEDQAKSVLANMGGEQWIAQMNADTAAAKKGDAAAQRRLNMSYARLKQVLSSDQNKFQKYYDEYMARPQTQKTRDTARKLSYLPYAITIPTTVTGAGIGDAVGDKGGGAFAGGAIGAAVGIVVASILGKLQRDATESRLDAEAWRYATMRNNNNVGTD